VGLGLWGGSKMKGLVQELKKERMERVAVGKYWGLGCSGKGFGGRFFVRMEVKKI